MEIIRNKKKLTKKMIIIASSVVATLVILLLAFLIIPPIIENNKLNVDSDKIAEENEQYRGTVKAEDLKVEWWDVRTETGTPTFMAEIKNNGKLPVDFIAAVEFYKGNELFYTSEDITRLVLPSNETTLIWGSYKKEEMPDDIKISYKYIDLTSYIEVPVIISKKDKKENGLDLAYKVGNNFGQIDTIVAFFSDKKLVNITQKTIYSNDELTYFAEAFDKYDSYKVYVTAFK